MVDLERKIDVLEAVVEGVGIEFGEAYPFWPLMSRGSSMNMKGAKRILS